MVLKRGKAKPSAVHTLEMPTLPSIPTEDGVAVRVRLESGTGPSPGVQSEKFVWGDLLDGAPPRRQGMGEGTYAVRHMPETDRDLRVSYATVIRLDGPTAQPRVEERLSVDRRFLLSAMDRQRAFADRTAARWRAGLAKSLAGQRRRTVHMRPPWVASTIAFLLRIEARVAMWGIRAFRATVHAVAEVPDAVVALAMAAGHLLGDRFGRRTLRRGLKDPGLLSIEERAIVLLLAAAIAILAISFLNTLFALGLPEYAPVYRRVFADAALSFASAVAIPLPPETLLIGSVLTIGIILAFVGVTFGKLAASWILFILGDSLNAGLRAQTAGKPRLEKAVTWVRENADKRGGPVLFVVNVVPFLPDLLIYAFAASGMRFQPYMLAIAAGTAVKYALIIALVLWIGPDRVLFALAHPLAAAGLA